ncbi:MAG: hypothetical protein EOP53_28005 [Sphingobacteriales bacterium]|nr:MAG: hypothetical protein EOP53_28005 [Sphingobacteriales bacterium]
MYWIISKYHFSKTSVSAFLGRNASNLFILSIGAIITVYCLLQMPFLIPTFGVGMLLTLLYSLPLWPVKFARKLHRLGFLKTFLLALTWTYITVMIPVTGHDASAIAVFSLFFARFFFMLMLCAIFDSRDIAIDKMNSLRSLATDVSESRLKLIMGISFTLYICAGFFLRYLNGGDIQLWAFLITGLATFWVYHLSHKKRGYFFYYFIVDGLMLFSSVLTYVASIV